jgi:hypothetical protein
VTWYRGCVRITGGICFFVRTSVSLHTVSALFCHVLVTVDGIWIDIWIYWTLITCEYQQLWQYHPLVHSKFYCNYRTHKAVYVFIDRCHAAGPNNGYSSTSDIMTLTTGYYLTPNWFQFSKLLLASPVQAFCVSGPFRTHDHVFIPFRFLGVSKWGVLFTERRDLTTAGHSLPIGEWLCWFSHLFNKVKIRLWPTASRTVCLVLASNPSWNPRPDYCYCQYLICWHGAHSLERERVCCLKLLLVFASTVVLESESWGAHDRRNQYNYSLNQDHIPSAEMSNVRKSIIVVHL